MILLAVIATTTAAVQIVQGECNTLQDCLVFTERLQQQSPLLQKQGGYSCIRNRCTYTVSTGNLCRKVEDCSAFGFVSDSMQRNLSLNFNPTEFLKDLCSPQHCTIQSDCLDASFPFLNQNNSQTQGCCKGIPLEGICSLTGIEMCTDQHHCYPSPVESSSERICTVENKSNTQWIGIVLTLIGAATCNMALNLMKYAHRKRFEKQISNNGFMYGIKEQISNIYRNISGSTLNRDTVVGNVGIQENDSLDIDLQPNIKRVSAQEKPRFQKRLGMRDLFNNPRWLLGMFIFFLGNICNFIAFNFAAQSLLAPLNSISLVVNVFVAPMINGEIWGWNDVVGIVLIISGSTMVVVFAGFPPKDYTACVLVKLFKRTETIIFLCVTVGIVFLLFWYIVIVEKNLDLESEEIVLDKGKPKLHRRILDRLSKVRGFAFLHNIRLPILKQKIKLESPLVVYGLPLAYASLGVNSINLGLNRNNYCVICKSDCSSSLSNLLWKQSIHEFYFIFHYYNHRMYSSIANLLDQHGTRKVRCSITNSCIFCRLDVV